MHSSRIKSRNRANFMKLGRVGHLRVFATAEFADEWFKENDPEGAAFGYEVIEE